MLTSSAPAHARALAAVLALGAGPAWAVDCYRAGNKALDDGRQGDAVRAFEVAAELPECAASRVGLLHSKAVALHEMVEAGGDPQLACRAAETYRAVIGLEPTSRAAEASRAALTDVDGRCRAVAPPEPAKPSAPDHSTEWGLTLGAAGALAAGGVLLLLALDAQEERDAADARQLGATTEADRQAALDDFYAAGDRTDALGVTGYALAGVGGALAVAAAVTWAVDDAPVAVAPTLGGLTIRGAW